MKRILVPVDFTEVSFNALRYAMDLFGVMNEYHVVHVHPGLTSMQPVALESSMTSSESIKEEIEAILFETFDFDGKIPENIIVRSLAGEPVQRIKVLTEEESFDCAVIGTRDKYDLFDRWFGTTSLGMTKTMNIPIYLVPRYSTFEEYNKVVVSSDEHLIEQNLVQQIKEWNDQHKAYVKFLHIQSKDEDQYSEESKTIVSELFEKSDPDFGFEIANIKSDNISESLLANAYNFKADLLVVITEKQSFIQTLLFQSVSKKIILQSSIPVLFLHSKA